MTTTTKFMNVAVSEKAMRKVSMEVAKVAFISSAELIEATVSELSEILSALRVIKTSDDRSQALRRVSVSNLSALIVELKNAHSAFKSAIDDSN